MRSVEHNFHLAIIDIPYAYNILISEAATDFGIQELNCVLSQPKGNAPAGVLSAVAGILALTGQLPWLVLQQSSLVEPEGQCCPVMWDIYV